MKFNSTFIALSASAILFTGMANAAITGTPSVKMTFLTTVTSGTCTAKLVNSAGTETAEIGFGDVFKSDLVNKTRVEPFKITFSSCSGVTKATVSAAKGSGGKCSGITNSGDSYSGGLATGFEVWSGVVDTGVLMKCNTPPAAQEVTIANGTGEFPMNSRIVVGQGQTIADVTAGGVTAPVTFTITYP
ncbi:fimbrial protein [Citrobacter sp. Cpo090]|uniref:fimbrial protein n=1 Tax=Citrobacter sp. Cpo090 TaxID=2985139 RepID=UPI001A274FC6|nr:fimbrial protein [Citrobacter sp. Cpo090]MDM2845001.1 fimbrial protein [Citrobacter sp. Cpo090]